MPVTLDARAVGDALAPRLEHDVDAELALSWLGWDGEGPLRIRRYDLLAHLSYGSPKDAIRAFAGDDIEAAVLYPEDERYLIGGESTVTHYEVADHIETNAE